MSELFVGGCGAKTLGDFKGLSLPGILGHCKDRLADDTTKGSQKSTAD